jgi:hypothetical protein
MVVSIYKLSDLTNNTALGSRYDTHSIPGYTILLNAPANKHTALALMTHTSNTPHTHPITTAPLNSSTTDLVSLYFESPSVLPKPHLALSEKPTAHSALSYPLMTCLATSLVPTLCLAPTVNPSLSGDCHAYVGKKKYKLVTKKVKPIGATLPEEFRIVRNIQGDPLVDLPILSPFPINFLPTSRYDQASFDIIEKNHLHGFLTAEEQGFMHHFMMIHQDGFAWNKTQKGSFRKDFFPPVHMLITKHIPWVLRNMPIRRSPTIHRTTHQELQQPSRIQPPRPLCWL